MFQTFQDPNLINALNHVAKFVQDAQKQPAAPPHWLTLSGDTGTGKSHLARQIWRHFMSKPDFNPFSCRVFPRWIYWPGLVDAMRDINNREKCADATMVYDDMQRWPHAAIDDPGVERDQTGFAAEKFANLMERRVGKWTVITTNLDLPQISEKMGARIADRFIRGGNRFVKMNCASYALRKRNGVK